MIKPNLICSHNWHVQPCCQRSLRAVRLSGALLDRGPGCDARVVLELDALAESPFSVSGRFLRELSKPIELLALCQTFYRLFSIGQGPLQQRIGWGSPQDAIRNRRTSKPFRLSLFRAAQIFQTATSIA
jgi:hypothetical protein